MGNRGDSQPIQRAFLTKFVIKFSVVVLVGVLAASLLLFMIINRDLGESYYSGIYFLSHLTRNLIKYLMYSFAFQLIIISLATIVITLLASHKIAGPLFRLEKISDQIARGELPERVRIRSKDQIQSLAYSMDNMVQQLKTKLKKLNSNLDRIRESRPKIEQFIEKNDIDSFRREFDSIKKEIDSVEEILKSFRSE